MIFNLNKATRLSIDRSRSNASWFSSVRRVPTPELRASQDNQRIPAGSGMFGLLVSNHVGSRWF